MKLIDLKVGETAKIIKIEKKIPSYRNKLLAMGLTPGTTFKLIRIAPLGDPIEIIVRGFSLILRKKEADVLSIEKAPL